MLSFFFTGKRYQKEFFEFFSSINAYRLEFLKQIFNRLNTMQSESVLIYSTNLDLIHCKQWFVGLWFFLMSFNMVAIYVYWLPNPPKIRGSNRNWNVCDALQAYENDLFALNMPFKTEIFRMRSNIILTISFRFGSHCVFFSIAC